MVIHKCYVGKCSTEGLGLVGVGYNLDRMVGEGLSERGRFEQRSDRGERVSHETVEGSAFQAGGSDNPARMFKEQPGGQCGESRVSE